MQWRVGWGGGLGGRREKADGDGSEVLPQLSALVMPAQRPDVSPGEQRKGAYRKHVKNGSPEKDGRRRERGKELRKRERERMERMRE